jgi:hypothetical protein
VYGPNRRAQPACTEPGSLADTLQRDTRRNTVPRRCSSSFGDLLTKSKLGNRPRSGPERKEREKLFPKIFAESAQRNQTFRKPEWQTPEPRGMNPETDEFQARKRVDLESDHDGFRYWLLEAVAREKPRIGTLWTSSEGGRKWMEKRGIKDGEWLMLAKTQLEPGLAPGTGHTLRSRLLCYLMLHCTGYQGELALYLAGGKFRAVTSCEIRNALNNAADAWAAAAGLKLDGEQGRRLHVARQEVRRAFAGLERDGLAFRALNDGRPLSDLTADQRRCLHEHDILLFCPFRPLNRDPKLVVNWCLPRIAPTAPSIKAARNLKLLGVKGLEAEAVANDAYVLEALEKAVKDFMSVQAVAKAKAQESVLVAANDRHIRNKEASNKGLRPSSSSRARNTPATTATNGGIQPTRLELDVVLAALCRWCQFPDEDGVAELFSKCRQNDPKSSASEIADVIDHKGKSIASAKRPVAFAIAVVPKCFVGEVMRPLRAERARQRRDRLKRKNVIASAGERRGAPSKVSYSIQRFPKRPRRRSGKFLVAPTYPFRPFRPDTKLVVIWCN